MRKCEIVENGVRTCDSLKARINESNAHKKGFCHINTTDLESLKTRGVGIAYKNSSNDR